MEQETLLATLYNLILNPGTRAFERTQLQQARRALERGQAMGSVIDELRYQLRPLAWRNNLTPDVADFYLELTGEGQMPLTTNTDQATTAQSQSAIFAGGCFWCMVEPFETHPGIYQVTSGYTGGDVAHSTYDQVLAGGTGHVEAVEIRFDPSVVSYADLVALYWQISDPTDDNGQFEDRGPQYRPVIFVQDERQEQEATRQKNALIASQRYAKPIVTRILPAKTFWPAETYHQQFYLKQPKRYQALMRGRRQLQKTNAMQTWWQKWRQRHSA